MPRKCLHFRGIIILFSPSCDPDGNAQDPQQNTRRQEEKIGVGVDTPGGGPVGKVSRQDGELPFMLRDQPVGVAGKRHPDPGDQGDQSCLDPAVDRKVSGSQEDEPYAGHQDHADEGACTQPFHVPGVMADREDGEEQPRRVPDHGKQRLFIRQYGRQRKPPDHKRKQRHGEPENGGDGKQQELSAAVHAVHEKEDQKQGKDPGQDTLCQFLLLCHKGHRSQCGHQEHGGGCHGEDAQPPADGYGEKEGQDHRDEQQDADDKPGFPGGGPLFSGVPFQDLPGLRFYDAVHGMVFQFLIERPAGHAVFQMALHQLFAGRRTHIIII